VNIQQIIALAVVAFVFAVLQLRRNAPTEILFSLALAIFVVCGIIEPAAAWAGFADRAVIAIGGLLVISAGLRSSGVLDSVGRKLLGGVRTERGALLRLAGVVLTTSAFLLNTALVAMMMPMVINWCRQRHISPSKLLLPISYLAILGGTCTLVGTSTNFVVDGELRNVTKTLTAFENARKLGLADNQMSDDVQQLIQRYDADWLLAEKPELRPMKLTDISWIGVPCALAGAVLLIFFGSRLLPNRTELLDSLEEQRREYLVEMMVTSGCVLVGKTVEEGGLRHLPGLFLIEIDRDGNVIGPVSPTDRICENDRLVFTGVVATIVDLEKIPGLIPAADINYEIAPEKAASRSLVEVVLSPSSPLVGTTIRQANFRQHYNAAVVAVHRNGERLPTKIGDIELSSGDTLLLQTKQSFVRNFKNRPDFYLVSGVEDSDGRRHNKLGLAGLLTLGLIGWLLIMPALEMFNAPAAAVSPAFAIFAVALGMICTRCVSPADARRSIDLPMLLTVGAAIGVGRAISACGASDKIASLITDLVGNNPYVGLVLLFATTVVLTEMLSNVAVAAMMFYIAMGLASQLDCSPRPFIMAIAMGASLSFVSPIGYQTNLMVMGPGGYRPPDYIRAGLPLSIVVGTIALILIPILWPF
jgi:di/tricarboxylate transporter